MTLKDGGVPPLHQLLPFAVTVGACFVWYVPVEEPSVAGMVLKCLPIVCLLVFLATTEQGQGESAKVQAALCFSLVGDAFLVWPENYFLGGIVFFGVAQGLYVFSFGWKGVSWVLGVALHGLNLLVLSVMLPTMPTLYLKVAIAIYSFTITSMFWRALDRSRFRKDLPGARRLCTALGAATFCVSDLCIVVLQLGRLLPHLYAQLIILSTYYLAQLLIVLGSAESFWASAAPLGKVK
ncbi:lysoplasmalogenase TMEM86B-like [Panulirus ornatus]|uniref:lysoplasmalogenase TMEM86B-like n=1 Tax=Panulirus ornatus TaxID=150431 RepID=UPI003A8BB551